MTKLVLIDGNAIIHRAFHAIKPLTTRDGELVNAVFGFTSILLTILSEEKPEYIACTFDAAKKTFRHEQYEEYKAKRVKAPDELYSQIPRIHEIVETLQIPKFLFEGYEADDLIGTIANKAEKMKEVNQTIIATSDMDALQLITKKTCVNSLHKGYRGSQCFTPKDVFEKHGITPEQIRDYKGLVGDSSDNIHGVLGIGPKTAVKLLQTYKNLEGVYNNLEDIPEKVREKLEKDKEEAFFSRELATIMLDVPIKFNLQECKAKDFDLQKILELFESLQFYSLMRRLQEWKGGTLTDEEKELLDSIQTKKEVKKPEKHKEQLSLF
jgi:DNA polymerase-1